MPQLKLAICYRDAAPEAHEHSQHLRELFTSLPTNALRWGHSQTKYFPHVVQSINVFHYLEEGDLCNREIHLYIFLVSSN